MCKDPPVLEEGGIGPSGLLTKMRRISMAIKFTELSVESTEAEREVMDKASAVNAMIGNLSTSLSREKTNSGQ